MVKFIANSNFGMKLLIKILNHVLWHKIMPQEDKPKQTAINVTKGHTKKFGGGQEPP